jgi:hypothetical protein
MCGKSEKWAFGHVVGQFEATAYVVQPRSPFPGPRSRERKMNQVLSGSHYIGSPMYMDTKVRYVWYSDVLNIVSQFSGQQPTKSSLAEAVTLALRVPKAKRV